MEMRMPGERGANRWLVPGRRCSGPGELVEIVIEHGGRPWRTKSGHGPRGHRTCVG